MIMVTKWLHVTMPRENTWVLPIWTIIDHAIKKGICSEPNKISRELGIHISTRLNMLPVVSQRINLNWKVLYSESILQVLMFFVMSKASRMTQRRFPWHF